MNRVLIILLLLSGMAHGAIARAGSCSATATSCTLSGTATGDLNIFFAYRTGSTTAPSLPASNFTIATVTGTTSSLRIYCRVASSGADTGSGTATNATAVTGAAYSGTDVPTNLSVACQGNGAAQGATNTAASGTTATFPALTMFDANDWVIGFVGAAAGSTCVSDPTGLTNVTKTGDVQLLDSNATASTFAQATCTVGSGTNISATIVLKAPPISNAGGPILKREYSTQGWNTNIIQTAIPGYTHQLDPVSGLGSARGAKAGDLVLIDVRYPSSGALTISDSTGGSNTWAKDLTFTSVNSNVYETYHSCLSADTTSISLAWSPSITGMKSDVHVFYNTSCGTTTPLDGTPVCTRTTATTNFGTATQTGSTTTTVNHDLIFSFAEDDSSTSLMNGITAQATAFGDDQLGLASDWLSAGYLAQYYVQPTAAAINPGFTFVQTTHTAVVACVAAYKAGTGGSAPGTGISILRSQTWFVGSTTSLNAQFPTSSGNLLAIGSDLQDITATSDDQNGSWTLISDATTSDPRVIYFPNAVGANRMNLHITQASNTNNHLYSFYEITGANASPLDTGVTAGTCSDLNTSCAVTNTNSGAVRATNTAATATTNDVPAVVPGAGNTDMFIVPCAMGTGPISNSTTGTWDYLFGTGQGDTNSLANGDGMAHGVANAAFAFNWTIPSTGNSVTCIAAGFKQAVSAVVRHRAWVITQ